MSNTCAAPNPSTTAPAEPPPEAALLHRQITTARSQLAKLRDQAREQIIDQYESGSWCFAGTNDALDDLKLPRLTSTYTGAVTITVDVRVDDADSEDQARNWVRNALDVTSTDSDVEIDDVHIENPITLH